MANISKLAFITDLNGDRPQLDSQEINNAAEALIILGDIPGSQLFNEFRGVFYKIYNLIKNKAPSDLNATEKYLLEIHIKEWSVLNAEYGHDIKLGGQSDYFSLALSFLDYPHFGAYRQQALPLSIQAALFDDTLARMEQIRNWFEEIKVPKILVYGNVDQNYFSLFPPEVRKKYSVQRLLGNSITRYDKDFQMHNLCDKYWLTTIPFYPLIQASKQQLQTFASGIYHTQKHQPRPTIFAMHGLPRPDFHTVGYQDFHAANYEDDLHIASFQQLLRECAINDVQIDQLVYGHYRQPIGDQHSSYLLPYFNNDIPTKYVHRNEVFFLNTEKISRF